MYCVKYPQSMLGCCIRLEPHIYLCDYLSGHVQRWQVVKVICRRISSLTGRSGRRPGYMCPKSCLWMAPLSKPPAGISNLRHSIFESSSVIARTSAMFRCGRVVAILTKKCAQMHTINATNHNLHRLAMMIRSKHYLKGPKIEIWLLTTMWANVQRDGRPAEYRWRPLFNAAKFGWRPVLECRAVMLWRRESRWNLQWCPKLVNGSQRLVGRSSPYYEELWTRYCCLTSFFRLSIYASAAKIPPDKFVRCCQNGYFLRPVLAASRVQHISEVHSNFAPRPHHVWKYGRHPISDRWD